MDQNSGQGKPLYDFGGLPATAPSTKRVDVLGWACASAVLGAVAGMGALALSWRELPGLAPPPGALGLHAAAALRCAVHWLFPPAFAAEARAYCGLLAKMDAHGRGALAWRGAAGACAACMPAILLARGCLAPRDGLITLRGSARHEGREAARRLNAEMASRVKVRPDHPIAPGVPYSADMWTRHVLLVAGVGAGKSTVLRPLIEAVVAARESMLLFDPKGEFTKGFGEPGLMAPWDRRSLSWDIARDMRNIGDMRRFAGAMIKEAQDPMWSNAARQILVGFMIYLKSTRASRWGWRELADMMATPQASLLPIMSKYHPEAVRAVERASVTTQGILINLSSFSASIFDLAEAWGDTPEHRRVSFVEWAHGRGRHRQIILQGHGAYPDLTRGYLEGVIGTVSAIVNSVEMDDDENRKLWLIADECGQMGKVPMRPLLDVGRSRGVRCVLACQDLAQLEEIHGALMVKALVSMVGTVLVGQIMQGDTAEQMCKALGTREVERQNISSSQNGAGTSGSSTTLSFSRDELAIYKPAELASRLGPTPDGKGVRLALLTGGNAYELFWPHYKMRRARLAHVPAEWTRGVGPAFAAGEAGGSGAFGDPLRGPAQGLGARGGNGLPGSGSEGGDEPSGGVGVGPRGDGGFGVRVDAGGDPHVGDGIVVGAGAKAESGAGMGAAAWSGRAPLQALPGAPRPSGASDVAGGSDGSHVSTKVVLGSNPVRPPAGAGAPESLVRNGSDDDGLASWGGAGAERVELAAEAGFDVAPTAEELGSLLRQSVEIRSSARGGPPAGATRTLASTVIAEVAGMASGAELGGKVEAAAKPSGGFSAGGGAGVGGGKPGGGPPPDSLPKEVGVLLGEAAIHAVGGEPAGLAAKVLEVADALRPAPGPSEILAVAQRNPPAQPRAAARERGGPRLSRG